MIQTNSIKVTVMITSLEIDLFIKETMDTSRARLIFKISSKQLLRKTTVFATKSIYCLEGLKKKLEF